MCVHAVIGQTCLSNLTSAKEGKTSHQPVQDHLFSDSQLQSNWQLSMTFECQFWMGKLHQLALQMRFTGKMYKLSTVCNKQIKQGQFK